MKELALVHALPTKRDRVATLRETPTQSWERQASGDYLVRIDEFEYVVPATGVKYERRPLVKKAPKP